MSSERRIIASRANGAKSRGPITPEGKLASSRNSLRHGLLARTVVLEDESSETFIELLASYRQEHQPETPTEEALIENMAAARWRQMRLWNMETAGLDQEIHKPEFARACDPLTQAFIAFRALSDETRSLELINRYEARYDRQFKNSITSLQRLRAGRPSLTPSAHPTPVSPQNIVLPNEPTAPPAAAGSPRLPAYSLRHPVRYNEIYPTLRRNCCWILQFWPWKTVWSSKAGVLVRPPNAPAK